MGWCLLLAGVPLLLILVTWGVWLGVIGLGFSLRCRGDVGAGICTGGRLVFRSLSTPPFVTIAFVSPVSFSCFRPLFFPPSPADTSAKTLSGSPFSFLTAFESESSSIAALSSLSRTPSFLGEAVLTLVLLV